MYFSKCKSKCCIIIYVLQCPCDTMLKDTSCMLVSSRRIQIKPLTHVFTITIPLVNQNNHCCQEYVLLCNTHVYMFAYNSCNSCIQLMKQLIYNADIKFYRGILEIVVLFRYDKYLKYTHDIVIRWRVISLSPHDVTNVSNMRAHSLSAICISNSGRGVKLNCYHICSFQLIKQVLYTVRYKLYVI
jgi:hypothetical protein